MARRRWYPSEVVKSMPSRTRRRAALVAALAFAVALLVAAGHRHEQHQTSEVGCAVCTVAHHSPAVEAAPPAQIAPATASSSAPPTARDSRPHPRGCSIESDRAPPRAILA